MKLADVKSQWGGQLKRIVVIPGEIETDINHYTRTPITLFPILSEFKLVYKCGLVERYQGCNKVIPSELIFDKERFMEYWEKVLSTLEDGDFFGASKRCVVGDDANFYLQSTEYSIDIFRKYNLAWDVGHEISRDSPIWDKLKEQKDEN